MIYDILLIYQQCEYTLPREGFSVLFVLFCFDIFVCFLLFLLVDVLFVCLMVFNVTFNNISAITWRSVLLVEETGGPRKNDGSAVSH